MEAGNFDSGNQQQAALGQQHMLPASARLAAHAASSARCQPSAVLRAAKQRLRRAMASSARCTRSLLPARVWCVSGDVAASVSASEMVGVSEQSAGGGWGRKERGKDGFRVSMVSIIEVPMAP